MRAPLSVIIPTLNAAAQVPRTAACLFEGLDAGLVRELVLSDGDEGGDGGGDAIAEVAEALGAKLVTGPAGRGGQLARGAAAAQGDWLLFLHADTHLSPGWAQAVAAHIRDRPGRAGWFRLRFRGGALAGRIVAGWANLRSRAGLPYGDQGLLISRELYESVGGFPEIALMEDVAIARRLRGRLSPLEAFADTDPARFQRRGWLRQGTSNLLRLLRFRLGADPDKLARRYR